MKATNLKGNLKRMKSLKELAEQLDKKKKSKAICIYIDEGVWGAFQKRVEKTTKYSVSKILEQFMRSQL